MEIALFRIIQEAVANIAHHARAENVFVLFKIENSAVHVDIEDDGEGFDLGTLFLSGGRDVMDRRGLGLLGMRERVVLIGGKIEICSMPGLGTRIDIRIPIDGPEKTI